MTQRMLAGAMAGAAALLIVACGGTPTTPSAGGNNGGMNTQPPPNNPPVIDSISIQGTRSKEPANFADAGEAIAVTAKVHDDETPVDQLQYVWTAPVGTFSGSGATVTWTAPSAVAAPSDVVLTLEVIEKYGFPGGPLQFEHDVSGTSTLSLHNSTTEVGDMARQFLLDFSDSTITDVAFVMRNFQPGCYGTQPETEQVTDNRAKYFITDWSVGVANVIEGFSSVGPVFGQHGDAFAGVPVHWHSRVLAGGPDESNSGTDWVAAFYYPDQKRWRLCDSRYDGHPD